jgi:hypothetical protein
LKLLISRKFICACPGRDVKRLRSCLETGYTGSIPNCSTDAKVRVEARDSEGIGASAPLLCPAHLLGSPGPGTHANDVVSAKGWASHEACSPLFAVPLAYLQSHVTARSRPGGHRAARSVSLPPRAYQGGRRARVPLPATARAGSRPWDRRRGGQVTRRKKCALFFLFADFTLASLTVRLHNTKGAKMQTI